MSKKKPTPDIEIIQQTVPKFLAFHIAKAMGYPAPPMLYIFKDTTGRIRHERVPL